MVADVTSGNKPLTVNFNAAGSTDSDGIDTVSTYTFNFGDGTDDVVQSTPVASYTFTQAGVYDVKTVVADSRAMVSTNTAHQIIQVFSDNLPPIANLVADTTSGAAPLTVSFDASGSTDPDNSIASYTFDFGDGSAADTRSTPTVSHIYANQGTYTATLSVTDSLGKVSAALASVVISATRVPTLTITSIVPSSLCAGGPDTTVTITGTGFLPGATVVVNGSSRTATLTASQLTFTMTAAEIASPGNVSLRVVNTDESTSPGATLSVIADTLAPVVTPPAAVTVLQTTCTNSGVAAATPGSSPELAAFMAGATATDSCGVIAMAPQMAGADVTDSTVYSAGVHTVTFRFRDNAGHVGTATGTVTVRPSGDLDADDAVSATDLVILANYLVGNLAPESDTFKSTRVTADLNRDGAVNAVDIVVAANHLVGNIGCLAN
jgi:PKD repeat protein